MISEERRQQTITLLLSAPLASRHIVLGKFFGVLSFLSICATLPCLLALTLMAGTTLDMGQLFTSVVGLLLLAATFTAIGTYISSLTAQPAVATVLTFGVLFILSILHWAADISNATGTGSEVLRWLSLLHHQHNFQRGVLHSTDIIYYLLLTTLFLLLSIRRLDSERLQS